MIDLIRGRLVVAQDGHDTYVDLTRKDKEQEVGDLVLLKVFPWKPLERIDEIRKERKAKSTNCWTLGYIKEYWEVSI